MGTDISMPLEAVRIAVALSGCAIGAYYDVFNNKNVPNTFLYGFLVVAFLVNLIAFHPIASAYGIGAGLVVFAATWMLYKAGQLGGADVFILAAIALLLPVQPSLLMQTPSSELVPTLPFIISVLIASGLSFMLYMFVRSLPVAVKAIRKQGSIPSSQWTSAIVVLLFYGVVAYVTATWGVMASGYFSFLTVVVAATIYFILFKSALNDSMMEEVPVSKIEEEDVLALDKIDAALVKKYGIGRLADAGLLSRLKGYKGKLPVMKGLPPFVPHLLIGLVLSLLLGNIVLYIAGSPGAFVY